jgi:hypothetical protein
MNLDINTGKGKLSIEVRKLGVFGMFRGLMFKSRYADALLFDFKRQCREGIHSFFCPRFLGLWIDEKNNLVEYKIVEPNIFLIKPKKKFRKLVEIPISEKHLDIIKFIVGYRKVYKVQGFKSYKNKQKEVKTMGKVLIKNAVERKSGYLYYIDGKGNVCEAKMARGGRKKKTATKKKKKK